MKYTKEDLKNEMRLTVEPKHDIEYTLSHISHNSKIMVNWEYSGDKKSKIYDLCDVLFYLNKGQWRLLTNKTREDEK